LMRRERGEGKATPSFYGPRRLEPSEHPLCCAFTRGRGFLPQPPTGLEWFCYFGQKKGKNRFLWQGAEGRLLFRRWICRWFVFRGFRHGAPPRRASDVSGARLKTAGRPPLLLDPGKPKPDHRADRDWGRPVIRDPVSAKKSRIFLGPKFGRPLFGEGGRRRGGCARKFPPPKGKGRRGGGGNPFSCHSLPFSGRAGWLGFGGGQGGRCLRILETDVARRGWRPTWTRG